ncbi:MAG: DUF4399 domain-containing protein [Anaerolineae bacterium]|nr:DUF4399 domain-containing protein [Thermoflexales bacterium]MCX7939147.1 DUF4399 domain-containing protein [Thermoflexales bacterium]MDW8053454.1 DUF4399 domain-containing protein [Anaerolineae bacterium]MDW8395288.1 DUF4399 domain-containing protein [Anaerolineae bacterium]
MTRRKAGDDVLAVPIGRRELMRAIGLVLGTGAVSLVAGCAPRSREPSMRFLSPMNGMRVESTKVLVRVEVQNFRLVRPGAPRPGEGHLHLFIDVPASAVPDGEIIPTGKPEFVHMGTPPFAERVIELTPGVHTITAVMGDNTHAKLSVPPPVSVTFLVQPPGT